MVTPVGGVLHQTYTYMRMADSSHTGSTTIMIVDDDTMVLQTLSRSLRGRFDHVIALNDPVAALQHLKTDGASVDILLTDIAMPELTGTQLAKMARRFLPRLTVLFISGFINEQQQRDMPENSRLLCKPFTPMDLVAFVVGEENEDTDRENNA